MKLKFAFIIAILCVGFTMNAQTKVGTVNSDLIISKMPQLATIQERIANYGRKLDSSFQVKIIAYQTKLKAYTDKSANLTDAKKKEGATEINKMNNDVNKFRTNGTKMLELRRNNFMRPLYKKVSDMIQQIAKKQGYTQILTTSGNEFGYIDERYDITKLVLAELGIKE
jgi:outer membrane protein